MSARCWFHRWEHVTYYGLAALVEHRRCRRCGSDQYRRLFA